MKAWLGKLWPQQALGVHVAEHTITLSRVAATPLGNFVVDSVREPYEPDQLNSVLERMLTAQEPPWFGRRMPVALGLSRQKVFFSTRPVRAVNVAAAPEALLHEMLQSPSLSIDDMAVDVIRAQPGKRPLAAVAACRKRHLTSLLSVLEGRGLRLAGAEPGPCALLRTAASRHRAPFRSKTVARVFLGSEDGLAMAVTGGLPVVWRHFTIEPGGEASALCSIVRRLEAVLGYCGVDGSFDAILIHGSSTDRTRAERESLEQAFGCRAYWYDGPCLDDQATAFGLALGCFSGAASFDLARSMKPAPGFRDLFPRGELAMQGALLVCMALFLNFTSQHHLRQYRAVDAECRKHPWMLQRTDAELAREKKSLQERLGAISRFVDSRIVWTRYAEDLASDLPAQARLEFFQGVAELRQGKQKTPPKRQLMIQASLPLAKDGTVPREIDKVLAALRGTSRRQQDFPVLSQPDIHVWPEASGQPAHASVTVVCLPATTRAKPDHVN